MKWKVVIVVAAVAAAVGAGWLIWWAGQPHSAAEQYERACAAENKLRAGAADLAPNELVAERERVIRLFEKVYQEFEDDGFHDDAKKRIAELCEELAEDKVRAAGVYERLLADHPDGDLAEETVRRLARLYKEIGVAEKDHEASLEWFRKAVDLLEKFLADHAGSPWAEEATLEIARLWQDHIQEPPIEAKKALDRYLSAYPEGELAAEAHFRMGKWYEGVKEIDSAIREYTRVTKGFPNSPYVDQALERLEEIYAKKTGNPDEAAKIARQLAERNRGTAKGARYAVRAKDHEAEKIKKDSRKYEGEYYGAPTVDVTADKPLPYEQYADLLAQKLDTLGYTLDVLLDPESGGLKVTGRIDLVNGGDPKESLLLQLNGAVTLENVKLDGSPVEVVSPSKLMREVVALKLSKPWAAGARGTLTFEVSGKFDPPAPVPEGIDIESGQVPTPELEAKIRENLQGDPRIRIGEAGYAISGAAWYPLTVYGDVFTADVTYRLPSSGFEVAATGRMTVPPGSSGTVRRYVSETPIFGLYFAYGKYVPVETAWSDDRVIVAYVPEGRRDLGRRMTEMTRDILAFYEPKFGRLKQPRLSIIISPLPVILGGIGPAGMMILAEHFVGDKGPSISLMAHELSHQWWGNVVPISFEKGYSMWLSEGFATYCDALYNEHVHGRDFLIQHLRKYGIFYFEGVTKMPGAAEPVADCMPMHPFYRQTVYEKGALVLHTLRYMLGDEMFFAVLRRYATEFESRHSTVEDFRKIVEDTSGKDYRWFFDDWLRRKGFPHYVVTGLDKGTDADGPYTATIRQELRGTDAPWRTPLDVAFYGPDGKSHVVRKARMDGEENTVSVRLPWEPDRVELDPDHWVFRHPGPDNEWPHPEPEPPAEEGGSPAPAAPAEPAGGGGDPAAPEGTGEPADEGDEPSAPAAPDEPAGDGVEPTGPGGTG